MAFLGGGATSLPFGPGGAPVSSSLMGGPRQPPKGMLNLTKVPKFRSARMDRGGNLLGIMRLLAARRGGAHGGAGGPPTAPSAPLPPAGV
jgi:hypothetical protein